MMLLVTLWGVSASWDDDDTEWVSRDLATRTLLNDTIPDGINSYAAPMLKGGRQGIALKAAQDVFGDRLVVVKKTDPDPPPKPRKGVVH